MVQIVNKCNFEYLLVLLIAITLPSCAIWRKSKACKLNPERNEIIGNDKDAKRFLSDNDKYYLPLVIEKLLNKKSLTKTNYKEPPLQYMGVDSLTSQIRMLENPNAISKLRGGYRIEGCADTTWAKKRMAIHLMKKYKLARRDSFYIKDIFTYSLNKDSIHLLTPHDLSSNIIRGHSTSRGYKECIGCTIMEFIGSVLTKRGFKFNSGKEFELNPDKNFHDQELLKNKKFHLKYYFKEYKEFTESEVVSSLQNEFGILLSFEKTDTIPLGYYKYYGEE